MAKDVITRFKLETTQYDSKIKNAAKELSDIAKSAKSAGADFERFTKDSLEAARSLGTIATSSVNAKDRAKELVGAFNDVARSYNQLTEEQKKSDFGKAVADSLTHLQQRIRETKEEMKGLEAGGDGLFGGGKLDGMLQVFGGNLMTKGVELAASAMTSLISETGDMIKQGVELAKQGEGIRIAFDRLGRGDIMDGLREATHGTVTDLELMKAAVKFNDFKLPVEELGTMLAFAQQKAKDTGQSVDYMVDSIVTGLGRKSLMILDNVGLSAAEIKERMKETGDMTKAVGAIIRDQMAKAGDYVETAADRAAQANVNLQNKMEELGRKFAPVEEASSHLWTSIKIGILDIIGGPLAKLLNGLTEAGRRLNAMNDVNGNDGSGQSLAQRRLNTLREYSGSQKGVTKQTVYDRTVARYAKEEEQAWRKANEFAEKYKNTLKELDNVDPRTDEKGVQASAIQQQANKYKQQQEKYTYRAQAIRSSRAEYQQGAQQIINPITPVVDTKQAETNVKKLRQQLKELEEQRKKAIKAGDQEQVESLTKQISQTKTNIGYLDPTANNSGSSTKTAQTEQQENQAKINTLTQEYVKLGDESTEAARERQAEIQKEIELLQQRNGLLNKRVEQAQGRLLSNDDIKRKAEIDIQANTKQIEDLRRQLTEIEGVTIDPKTIDVTANTSEAQQKIDELKVKIAELEDKNINIKAFVESIGKPLGEGLNKTPGTLWKAPETEIPRGGLQLSDKQMKAVNKSISGVSSMADGIDKSFTSAASAVSALGSAFASIEDPAAKVIGTVSQAIATVALGYATATTQAATMGPWAWIAFAATGLATMISTISAIHSSTGYAEGGMIKGNSYSGDNLMAMGPNGALIGLNAGEIVLNKSQQNNLASQLQGNPMGGLNLTATIRSEQIRLALNNNGRRTGRGEYVQSRNVR